MSRICHAHCPPEGGALVAVLAGLGGVALAVAFVLAHAVILAIGAAGVLAVTAVSQWALHRFGTVVYTGSPLRAPRKARQAVAMPAFRELAERQPAAIPQRRPVVITGVVVGHAEVTTTSRRRPRNPQTP